MNYPNTSLWLLYLLLIVGGIQSQAQTSWGTHDLPIYQEVPESEDLAIDGILVGYREVMPIFEGCVDLPRPHDCSGQQLMEAFCTRLKYPEVAHEIGTEGLVVISFTIEKDGKMTQPKVLRNLGNGLGEEALRVFDEVQEHYIWTPGTLNEKVVSVQYNMPIRFRLDTVLRVEHPPIDR